MGHPAPIVEDVLRSNGSMLLSEVPAGLAGLRNQFLHRPSLGPRSEYGYYCTYAKRPGEVGIGADCPGARDTVRQQANLMTAAGLDYMLFDHTNFNH